MSSTTSVSASSTHARGPIPNGGGLMRRLNLGTAILCGFVFALVGYYISGKLFGFGDGPKNGWGRDRVWIITMVMWALGFLTGIGAFVGPFRWLRGKDLTFEDRMYLAGKNQGVRRYFKFTTDHKVVGIQYLIVTMLLFFVGGILAMLIRTNLISPTSEIFGPQTYNAIVGLHGIIMIIATIIMVTGPFGNFVVPIMIGARDMAFPRLNALSLWLIVTVVPILLSAAFLGGIPTGWSAYEPLGSQAPPGMDSYLVTIIIFAISSAIAGANILTTVLQMRTRGMTWNRTPIFVYGVVASVGLALPAFPTFMASQVISGVDRATGTVFYDTAAGGNDWLYTNLFWLMGHPEVYVILLPGIVAMMEFLPVFVRKPLFNFNAAVIGIAGIVGLSVMVWAHHMYMTGWAPNLNAPFMLTTELISVPTGMLFLVFIGTLWRGRVWARLPMLAVYAMLWNFIIGGITGIYLSDVPIDVSLHGSMFVTAHFHYTLMGAGLVGAMGAVMYWFPKMTGRMFDEKLGGWGFWISQVGFNVTFFGMFAVGLAGQPRRVSAYSEIFKHGNQISTMGAYTIFIGMLLFLSSIIHSWRNGEVAPANPWGAKTLEWQVPTPVPLENFEVLPVITSDPYGYGVPQKAPKEHLEPVPAGEQR